MGRLVRSQFIMNKAGYVTCPGFVITIRLVVRLCFFGALRKKSLASQCATT